ncbi:MAG: hypothetical protein AB7Q76_18365 [Gammaproteobacteria bacterium]
MEITLAGSGQEKGRIVSGRYMPKYLILIFKIGGGGDNHIAVLINSLRV